MEKSDLSVTAQLANLELSDSEFAGLSQAVEQMLEYFKKMQEIDTDDLEPTTHVLLKENRLRPDTVKNDTDPDVLLENAPELEDRFVVIPNVL